MQHHNHIPPKLAVQRAQQGADQNILVVQMHGNWLDQAHLPDISNVTKELTGGGATALEFDANELGRWDSALMVRILEIRDQCAKFGIDFRARTLPAGLAKLIALSQAVPETSDAVRNQVKPSLLERVGDSDLATWIGGRAVLSFLGEGVVSLLKVLSGRAQFRGRDLLEVIEASGPRALGIVALINFLVGLILAFVGAGQLARFGDAPLRNDLDLALEHLAAAAQSISSLADFLKEHPNALIAGRQLPNRKP